MIKKNQNDKAKASKGVAKATNYLSGLKPFTTRYRLLKA
jgi:hypothetical protein